MIADRILARLLTGAVLLWVPASAAGQERSGFDHPEHARLFPRCETCHSAPAGTGAAWWPDAASCAACHDGTIEPRVTWQPRRDPRISNLRFDHVRHGTAAVTKGDSLPTCAACHQPAGEPWMNVAPTIVAQCLDCHRQTPVHLAVADTACGTCHLSLADARRLPRERVGNFPAPPDHGAAGFEGRGVSGHGRLAQASAGANGSCATCHARDFCLNCHVNGPETASITALASDARSLAIPARLAAPPSHAAAAFAENHSREAGRRGEACATCHTRGSCAACHVGAGSGAVRALAAAGPGRAVGAIVKRRIPRSHGPRFDNEHAALAAASEQTCATCHVRDDCLQCHRPDPGSGGGYHPTGFLARHPASAYGRETSCADCHDTRQFCVSCHAQAGMSAVGPLGQGRYHDAKRFFLVGHGQAARQSLESCVSCHAERDCLTCHAAQGGRRFNPHGPGFDPERLRRRNPEMCTACHGAAIPRR